MDPSPGVWVVMPALDEEESIGHVLDDLPQLEPPLRVVVADNGSSDATADVARARGATVVLEARRGYGQACLTALAEVRRRRPDDRDIVVFLDADYSDHPEELPQVIEPLVQDRADVVIGSRVLGQREAGALLPQARAGNWLATRLIRVLTGVRFTDLGPFRAVRWGVLESLRMEDTAFGWTVELQLKAASVGLRCVEVPVSYRRRRGASKITGTIRGTVLAGTTILSILGRYALPGRGGLWRRGFGDEAGVDKKSEETGKKP